MRKEKSALTEKQIVEAVCKGHHEGQTEMVCRYADRVFATIVRQVNDVMDAQELTQDTFLRAFSHIGSFDANGTPITASRDRFLYIGIFVSLKNNKAYDISNF